MIELGGNITLSGFKELDRDTMVIVKKIVGTYVKKFSETNDKFQSLAITLKHVHERETSEKFEIKANLTADKQHNSDVTDRNLMFALDNALKKVDSSFSE